MICLWGRRTSINVQRVMWVLAELQLQYERRDVGGSFGGLDDAAYTALHPHRKIPTLVDDSAVIWESNAIVRYLADAYGRDNLFGATPAERGMADMWMEWYQNAVYPHFMTIFHQTVRLPDNKRSADALARAQEIVNREFSQINTRLESSEYVSGNRLTLGDVPFATGLYRYYTMDIQRPAHAMIERYYEKLTQRPAYHGNVMINYDSLRPVTQAQ